MGKSTHIALMSMAPTSAGNLVIALAMRILTELLQLIVVEISGRRPSCGG